MQIRRTDPSGETRRHNGYGVDLTGGPANLDMAFLALNNHERLVTALRGLVAFVDDLDRARCGLDEFAGNYPEIERAYPLAIEALKQIGIDPFEGR
jgi:hypothetical protein